MCKVQVVAFNNEGKQTFYKSSGIIHSTLGPDEELYALHITEDIQYPLHVSAHIALLGSPSSDTDSD